MVRQTPEEVAIWICNNIPAVRPQYGPEDVAGIAKAIQDYGELVARRERERWRELATAAWVFCVNPDRLNQIRLEAELAALGMSVEAPHCTFDEGQPSAA